MEMLLGSDGLPMKKDGNSAPAKKLVTGPGGGPMPAGQPPPRMPKDTGSDMTGKGIAVAGSFDIETAEQIRDNIDRLGLPDDMQGFD